MTRTGKTPVTCLEEIKQNTYISPDSHLAFKAGLEAGIRMFARVVDGKEICGSYGWSLETVLEDVNRAFVES